MAGACSRGGQGLRIGLVAVVLLGGQAARAQPAAPGEAGGIATGATAAERPDPRIHARVRTMLSQQAVASRRLAATQIAHVRTRFPGVHDERAGCRRGLSAAAPAVVAPSLAQEADGAPRLEAPAPAPVSLPITHCEREIGATVWRAGSMEVGARQPGSRDEVFGFHSRGLTFGSERQVADGLTLGAGLGIAREQAEAAADGTSNTAEALSGLLYLSYRPSSGLFVDALAGHAALGMRSARPLGDRGTLAAGRGGSEWFTVLAAGFRTDVSGIDVAPYTRFEAVRATLHRATESAGGAEALQFDRQALPSWKLALGIEGASRIETAFGVLRPRASLEARQELEAAGSAAVTSAEGTAVYAFENQGAPRQSVLLGLGATLSLPDRWSLSAGYSLDHSHQARFRRVDVMVSRHLP